MWSLLLKDTREHAVSLVLLGAGFMFMVVIALAQNTSGTFSMSPLEVVRFSVITLLPLIAFILGNRLIVREYLGKTRLFVEALPIGRVMPLVLKYLSGLTYLVLLSLLVVFFAAAMARATDTVDPVFLALILARTLSMVLLIWSIVFCFSFCGFLRVLLYLLCITFVVLLTTIPGIDESSFGPFALMDSQLFAFEREVIPFKALLTTLTLASAFSAAGFTLALIGDGSVAELLSRPMSRRDYVAITIVVVGGLTLVFSLIDNNTPQPYSFGGDAVVTHADPPVSVRYETEMHRGRGEQLLDTLVGSLTHLQASTGTATLPRVRISLDMEREPDDIALITTSDGVLISANFSDYDSYDTAVLHTAVIHQVFQFLSLGRLSFEPNHWLLDGLSRWWVERRFHLPGNDTDGKLVASHDTELFALAALALRSSSALPDLVSDWQLLADRFSYTGAEALAYTAIVFLEQTAGVGAVERLTADVINQPVGGSSVTSVKTLLDPMHKRVEAITGIARENFRDDWHRWLEQQVARPDVTTRISSVPEMKGQLEAFTDEHGVHVLEASYVALQGDLAVVPGECVLLHERVSAFDTEMMVTLDDKRVAKCRLDEVTHRIDSLYAPGDRVYVALEYVSPAFHQRIRVWVGRINIP